MSSRSRARVLFLIVMKEISLFRLLSGGFINISSVVGLGKDLSFYMSVFVLHAPSG